MVKPVGTSGFFLIEATGVSSLAPVRPGLEVCIVPPLNDLVRWCQVKELTCEGATAAKVKLAGIETRNDVQAILGRELLVKETDDFAPAVVANDLASYVLQGDLPYTSSDLLGFVVFDRELGEIGTIVGILNNGAHALWEIAVCDEALLSRESSSDGGAVHERFHDKKPLEQHGTVRSAHEKIKTEMSFLFPAVAAYIVELNLDKKEAHITLPKGLLDAEAL